MLRSFIMTALALGWGSSSALSLTSEEIIAKLRAAGYSHIQELPAGKIKTYKAVKEGTARWHRDRDPAKSRRAVKEYLATLNERRGAPPARLCRSSSRHPIRQRNGPGLTRGRHSSRTPTTI